MDVDHGVITRSQLFTDSMNPAPLEALAQALQGRAYRMSDIISAGEALFELFPEQQPELQQVNAWLAENIW